MENSFSQVRTNQSVVVPGKNTAICESRVTPGHTGSIAVQLACCGFDQFCAADYFYSLRGKFCNEKFPVFIEHPGLLFMLDKMDIAVRTGNHCTQPIMKFFGIEGTVRASFAFYNTQEEIDYFVESLLKVKQLFS